MGFFKKYKSSISLIILGGLVFLFTIKFDSVLTSFKIGLDAVMPLVWGVPHSVRPQYYCEAL